MRENVVTVATFMRSLLTDCIGTVMFEPEQWEYIPQPDHFDRGYFNERLKHPNAVNDRTKKRLILVFSYLLGVKKQQDKFQKSRAVDSANALIALFRAYFDVDLSCWRSNHTEDNRESHTHLLRCLEAVLAICLNKVTLPTPEIAAFLQNYLDNVVKGNENTDTYTFLTAPPYQQTECFVGRLDIVSSVQRNLLTGKSCYLHGIGGIGKTEVAKSVLKSILQIPPSESEITHIMWVDYTENDFALSLVRALQIDTQIENIERAFQDAVNRINQYGQHLLLIVDNVENTEDKQLLGIADFLNCRIMITSRCDGFTNLQRIPVTPLELPECMELFYYYYHGQHNDIILRKIIELADRHTVTIELLSKIADTEEVFLYEFYDSLVRCGFHISSEEVTTAHEKMRSEGRVIVQLQKLFHVYGFQPDETRLLIQTSAIPNIPFTFDQTKRWFSLSNRTTLNRLSKRGWLKKEAMYSNGRNRYRYVMHSVIASAVRAQFQKSLYNTCQRFIREITVDMQESRDKNDAIKKDLIQFSWSLNDIFRDRFENEVDGDFLWALAEIYRDIGYYERALPLLDSLLQLYTTLYGDGCIQLGSVWNCKGMIAYELSHFDDAFTSYQNSRDILAGQIDLESPPATARVELAKLDLNIGKTYLKTDYTQAKPYFDRAYTTFRDELGNDNDLTLNAYGSIAMLLAHASHFEEAERIYLEIYEKTNSHLDDRNFLFLRADVAHNLGNLYTDYAPDKAMPLLLEARNIFWKYLSSTHPDTLDVLNTICSQELARGDDYEKCLQDFQRLLDLYVKTYGENDPNTGTVYNNIGLCHFYMNHPDEAISNYRKAMHICEISYGKNHESTAYVYNNIGGVYSECGQPAKAIPEHEHALRIYEAAYTDHMNLDLAQTHSDLADAYLRLGNIEMVEKHLNEAFAVYDNLLPENAHQYLQPCSTLANLLVAIGDYENAETQYSHVIWLMLENGYAEDTQAVQEFVVRIQEVRQMAADASKQS